MIRKILVALDGSPRASGVVAAAVEVGECFGATLIAVRAIQIPPEFPPAAHVLEADPLASHLESVAQEDMRVLIEGAGGVWAAPLVRRGQPWRAILDAAEQNDVDLMVLGSHGYDGIDRLLGTTAAKVANLAPRNVLIVHDRMAPEQGHSDQGNKPGD
jgi:nucleotide-binding universal stress UspA family protein